MAKASKAPVPPGQQRPGGRTEQVRIQVATSVLALIQEGRIDFTYDEVADVSGVNRATVYRRWPKRADLIKEALNEHNSTLTIPELTNWWESAEALIRELATFLSKPAEIRINLALIADQTAETNALMLSQWDPIQQKMNKIAKDAQAKGELPADIDPNALMLMLVSPLLLLTMLQRAPVDKSMVNSLVKIVKLMQFPE